MSNELTRRQFLWINTAAGVATVTRPLFALDLRPEERRTLLVAARTLFPHDGLGDRPYLRAVAAIAERCRRDAAVLDSVRRGVRSLERACLGCFTSAPEPIRVSAFKGLEGSRFFWVVYDEGLESLYGTQDMWRDAYWCSPRRPEIPRRQLIVPVSPPASRQRRRGASRHRRT
jgi:hypothetical protein